MLDVASIYYRTGESKIPSSHAPRISSDRAYCNQYKLAIVIMRPANIEFNKPTRPGPSRAREAIRHLDRAIVFQEQLAAKFPDDPIYRRGLSRMQLTRQRLQPPPPRGPRSKDRPRRNSDDRDSFLSQMLYSILD